MPTRTKILLLILLSSTCFGAMNLEVAVEMHAIGLNSDDAAAVLWPHSYNFLDSDSYDGATYYFEIVAYNSHASIAYDVILYDVTNSANKATISVPANSDYTRLRSSSWSPASADTITYGVLVPRTAIDANVRVYASRIIVVQSNATKTRIQIPMFSYQIRFQATSSNAESTTSATYTQPTPRLYAYYNKDTTTMADIASWDLEGIIGSVGSGRTGYVALFDVTDNDQVTGAIISISGATNTLVTANFANDAVNFDEGHDFELRLKTDSVPGTAYLQRACLYCNITNLSKAEVYKRVAHSIVATKTGQNYVWCRHLYDASNYSTPVVYFESTAICADNANTASLRDHLTNDVGSDGSDVANSPLNFNSATKIRKRSIALSPTDDDRFYAKTTNTTNNFTMSDGFMIIDCSAAAPPAAAGQVIFINEDW